MFSWCDPENRPLIVAHRGSSAHAPENTLAAFRRAIEDGADAIELDVRLSKDGEVVVFHDSRLERKTDGSGPVRDATLGELKKLHVESRIQRRIVRERIPTLSEVFELCAGRIGLNVEIKADRQSRHKLDIVDRCSKLIRQHHLRQSVLVSSFHHHYIKYLKQQNEEIFGGLLFHPLKRVGRSAASLAAKLQADYLIFGGASLRKYVVRRAHGRGLFVGEFRVNTERRYAQAVRYGVDAIITDDPARMRNLLSSMK